MGTNRRLATRVPLRGAPGDLEGRDALVLDVSPDGARLKVSSDCPLTPGSEVAILFGNGSSEVERTAIVMWCAPENGSNLVGLRFRERIESFGGVVRDLAETRFR